jgi:hypothetical protein
MAYFFYKKLLKLVFIDTLLCVGINKGSNSLILTNPGIATGVYVIRITGESQLYNKKLFVK